MYAQVVRVQLRPDTLEAVTAVFRDEVVPAARGQRGYVSAYLFIDREANRGMSLSLWETEADVAALAASGFYGEGREGAPVCRRRAGAAGIRSRLSGMTATKDALIAKPEPALERGRFC